LGAQVAQKQEYDEQYAASQDFNMAWEAADDTYMQFIKVSRVAFKNNLNTAISLGLSGRRKSSFSGWLDQTQQFYLTVLENTDFQTALARFGITLEKLQEGKALVAAVVTAKQSKESETGEAQQATKTRDAVLDALEDWMSDFIAIARIALEDTQLSETLGIVDRS